MMTSGWAYIYEAGEKHTSTNIAGVIVDQSLLFCHLLHADIFLLISNEKVANFSKPNLKFRLYFCIQTSVFLCHASCITLMIQTLLPKGTPSILDCTLILSHCGTHYRQDRKGSKSMQQKLISSFYGIPFSCLHYLVLLTMHLNCK